MALASWDGDRWRRTTGVLTAAVLAVALAAGIAAAPPRPTGPHTAAVPALRPTLTLPALLRIGGDPAPLPWPAVGQAALAVPGVGVLGSSGPDRPVPIASVAKAMTAYLVLTHHPLAAGQPGPTMLVTAEDVAEYVACRRRGEAGVRVVAGEVLTERQALEAVLLPSANNIARMLARWDSGSVPAFVARMNATAAALGMTHTVYTDPAGFDPATASTGSDQLLLAARAMAVPAFAAIVAERAATLPVVGPVHNVNRLLGTWGVIGIKTGSMTRSGGCLLFAARLPVAGGPFTGGPLTGGPGADGPVGGAGPVTNGPATSGPVINGPAGAGPVTVLGAVLGQPMTRGTLAEAFTAAQALVAAAGRTVAPYTLLRAGDPVGRLPGGGALVAATDVTVLGWPGLAFLPALRAAVPAAARDGAQVGTLALVALPAGTPVTVPVRVRYG